MHDVLIWLVGHRMSRFFFAFDGVVKRLLFPCNIANLHWVAIMVDMEHDQVVLLDPMGHARPTMIEHMKWFLLAHIKNNVSVVPLHYQ